MVSFRRIAVADGGNGWLVMRGGKLAALLTECDDGAICLEHGMVHPLMMTMMFWPDLDAAKCDLKSVL